MDIGRTDIGRSDTASGRDTVSASAVRCTDIDFTTVEMNFRLRSIAKLSTRDLPIGRDAGSETFVNAGPILCPAGGYRVCRSS